MEPPPDDVDRHIQSLFIRAQQRRPNAEHGTRKRVWQGSTKRQDAAAPKTLSPSPSSRASPTMRVRSESGSFKAHEHTTAIVQDYDLSFEDLTLDQGQVRKARNPASMGQTVLPVSRTKGKKRALGSRTSRGASNAQRAKSGPGGMVAVEKPNSDSKAPPPQLSARGRRSQEPGLIRPPPSMLKQLNSSKPAVVVHDKPSRPSSVSAPQAGGSAGDEQVFLIRQPVSQEISQDQLATEIKAIYAGLVMLEQKCIEYDRAQAQAIRNAPPGQEPRLENDQWQALIALHRTLLHEHHDFFLATQHPAATEALQRLPERHSMAARMWKHAIHSFLEVLRHHLPRSRDYMEAFIYIAYQMVGLLLETVPIFGNTWIECLGDLARYRMAIEDVDQKDLEIWNSVARSWYSKAADHRPGVGRLYHHLAILARHNPLQQLYFYCRSLTCVEPFLSARESILTLFNPMLARYSSKDKQSLTIETIFIALHAIIFKSITELHWDAIMMEFLDPLDDHVDRIAGKWRSQGVFIAVINIAALCGYGVENNSVRKALSPGEHSQRIFAIGPETDTVLQQQARDLPTASELSLEALTAFAHARSIFFSTYRLALTRVGDSSVVPHIYVTMVFLLYALRVAYVRDLFGVCVPWGETSSFLNGLATTENIMDGKIFAQPENRPLPEEYCIMGQFWCEGFWPEGYFEGAGLDEDERMMELGSTAKIRAEKTLWVGTKIAMYNVGLRYDSREKRFAAAIEGASLASLEAGSGMVGPGSPDIYPSE